jgi:hypothetical protein
MYCKYRGLFLKGDHINGLFKTHNVCVMIEKPTAEKMLNFDQERSSIRSKARTAYSAVTFGTVI